MNDTDDTVASLESLIQERHDLLIGSLRLGDRLRLTQAAADAARAYFDALRSGWEQMGEGNRLLVKLDTGEVGAVCKSGDLDRLYDAWRAADDTLRAWERG